MRVMCHFDENMRQKAQKCWVNHKTSTPKAANPARTQHVAERPLAKPLPQKCSANPVIPTVSPTLNNPWTQGSPPGGRTT